MFITDYQSRERLECKPIKPEAKQQQQKRGKVEEKYLIDYIYEFHSDN